MLIPVRPKFRKQGVIVPGVPPVVTADVQSVFAPNGNSNPINIGAGDLVVLVITGYALGSPVTASSPNLGSFTSDGFSASGGQVLHAYNTGGALTNEVITVVTAADSWHVYSISGAAAASPIETPAFIPATGSAQSLAVSITTAHATDLIFANIQGIAFTVDSGWTAAPAGQTPYGEVNEYKQVSATGTYTAWAGQNADGSSFIFAVKGP